MCVTVAKVDQVAACEMLFEWWLYFVIFEGKPELAPHKLAWSKISVSYLTLEIGCYEVKIEESHACPI